MFWWRSNWSQRAATDVMDSSRLCQTLWAAEPALQASLLCLPVSTSSRRSQGRESPAQVWTPGWPDDFHPAAPQSFGRCTRSPSSRSTCRTSQLSAALTCISIQRLSGSVNLTSPPPWQQAEHPAVQQWSLQRTDRWPVSSDTAYNTSFPTHQAIGIVLI